MELRYLRYFVAVAEDLNFTAAANRLRLSQPSLSLQIRDLERELDTPLFLRTSRHVELTSAGKAFFEHAQNILMQTEQATEQARAIGAGQIGSLDIGTTGSVLLGPLSSLVATFVEKFPQVTLRIHEMAPQSQEESLRAHRLDVCFIRRPAEDSDINNEPAWPAKVGVVLPEGHPLASQKEVALLQLQNERHVSLRLSDSRFARYLRDTCIEAGFFPNMSQQVVEAYSLTSLVAAGLGVALVPECISNLSRPGVVYRRLSEPGPVADVRMIYRQDASPAAVRMISMVREFAESYSI
ncbi:LysR substrate-binding domain-containing protein [Enterovirga sp.]|uniref:LysR substrate-binding domain-containing protein n=1 Tax=Enterovirga sp. TaxID=2026350 RepID=UPI002B75302E|nr:LysR substrate-binding domain-containing protein [Enterovirga sp.]HMO30970.1 LysR substrate-binding domain-containing protein [Enterovirga sp.]